MIRSPSEDTDVLTEVLKLHFWRLKLSMLSNAGSSAPPRNFLGEAGPSSEIIGGKLPPPPPSPVPTPLYWIFVGTGIDKQSLECFELTESGSGLVKVMSDMTKNLWHQRFANLGERKLRKWAESSLVKYLDYNVSKSIKFGKLYMNGKMCWSSYIP